MVNLIFFWKGVIKGIEYLVGYVWDEEGFEIVVGVVVEKDSVYRGVSVGLVSVC